MTGGITWGWAIEAMIASTVLMLVVLVLRGPVRRAFGPDVAYALWVLPVLRLVLPPLPATWHAAALAPVRRATEQVTVLLVEPIAGPVAAPVHAAAPSLKAVFASQLIPALAIAWLVGAVAFVLWHAAAHRRFCARMLAETASSDVIEGVEVIETAATSGPLAFGIWRRYVAFPTDMAARYDEDERALALAHELGHHARGDLFANWVALAVLALHWFNPVAWRAFRAFRADQEVANDARVLAGLSPMRRHAYACAIVKTAHPASFGAAVSTACHLHTIDDLKGRLKMLTTKRVSRTRLFTGAAAIAVTIAGGLALTASGTAAAAAAREGVEHATGVQLAALGKTLPVMATMATMQTAPVPPAPPVATKPDTPPVPPVAAPAPGDEHVSHTVKRVVVVKDGKTTTYDSTDVDAHLAAGDKVAILPLDAQGSRMVVKDPNDPDGRIEVQDIPAVHSAKCGIGDGKPTSMVINTTKGEKRMVVICTDRIRKVTVDATAATANSKDIERNAYRSALEGLRKARAGMATKQGPEREYALPAIDEAIAEIERDLANAR